ncbi:hypothetical protein ACTU3I_00845 [Microbacterium sp. RD1]|uniref:hypothetical protein n=1 Tax=Microbacterium sp. RD1 TaxID=3457313 RepID=UPI003FA5C0C0
MTGSLPTRDPAFRAGARYGAAVAIMIFSTYLAISTNFSAIVQSENYAGTIRSDVPLLDVAEFVLIVAGMVTAVAILPTRWPSRLGAVTLICVTLFLWATFGIERGAGVITEPVGFWSFVLDQGFATLLAAVGGWLIARGRHPLTWLFTLVCLLPSLVAMWTETINITTGAYALLMLGVVAVAGLAAVWAAAAVDRMLPRRARPGHPDAAGDSTPRESTSRVTGSDGAVRR